VETTITRVGCGDDQRGEEERGSYQGSLRYRGARNAAIEGRIYLSLSG
jgi:hypothetical protein